MEGRMKSGWVTKRLGEVGEEKKVEVGG